MRQGDKALRDTDLDTALAALHRSLEALRCDVIERAPKRG
jgi:hypothetical protein